MNKSVLQKFYDFLGTALVANGSFSRMMSLYKYANTFGIFIGFSLFLSLERYLNEQRPKIKNLYTACIFIQIFAILMTYSRMCWILIAVLLIAYIIWVKEHRKDIVEVIAISGINAIIYFLIYNYFMQMGQPYYSLIILAMQSILEYLLFFKLGKKIMASIPIAIIIIVTIIWIALPNKLVLFNTENSKMKYKRENIEVEANTQYSLKVKLNSKTNQKNNISMYVKELDSNEQGIEEQKIQIDNYNGTKEFNFKTQSDTNTIEISFVWGKQNNETRLEIEEVTLNDKPIKMYYKLIPIELINRIEKIDIDTVSIKTRIEYLKQSAKIIQKNWLFGQGGNAWRYIEKEDILLEAIAEHSYPMQLWIQNGIIAFIAYVLLIIFLIKCICKSNSVMSKSIGIALILVLTHSLLDFDMSFLNILIMTYMYIAIINETNIKTSKQINLNKYIKAIYILILTVILYFNIGEFITYYIDTDEIKNQQEKLNIINLKIILSPYDYRYYDDKTNCLSSIKNKGTYRENSQKYNDICKEIIETTSFITNIEKYKDPYMYNKIILNKIDLINEENQISTLEEIKKIWENDIGANNEDIYNGIKTRLTKKLDNEVTKQFVENLKLKEL